ncbi:hypothetical protein R1flu_012832 [Riccia fluitans]|uniref:Uncharacterized protein n=1 Tax=Riccia fluitans TaxID=41844 RepID=A0ABD1ZCR9_9MARC
MRSHDLSLRRRSDHALSRAGCGSSGASFILRWMHQTWDSSFTFSLVDSTGPELRHNQSPIASVMLDDLAHLVDVGEQRRPFGVGLLFSSAFRATSLA